MNKETLPTFFISHGGGPWPWMEDMRDQYKITSSELKKLGEKYKPKAILMISGHWEEQEFTLSTSAKPEMIYDYGGFPPHTYQIQYCAPGSPEVAARVKSLLSVGGVKVQEDKVRGFDHGTFVPLYCMYPQAEIPVVQLSMKVSPRHEYSAADHYKIGELLAPLRDEGILIIGSGLSFHNLRNFFNGSGSTASVKFEEWLASTVKTTGMARKENLVHWERAPFARDSHPREDHLIPLMVVAGAAQDDSGKRVILDNVYGISMASYGFGVS